MAWSRRHPSALRSEPETHETVQHGYEHRAFDIEVMVAGGQQLAHHFLAPGLTPQPFEDQCRPTETTWVSGESCAFAGVFCEHHEALGEPSRGAQELVDGAAGGELVEPAEGCDDGLLDALAFAVILGDLKVSIRADFLDTDEHVASLSLTPHIVGRLSRIFQTYMESFSKFLAINLPLQF